MIKIRTTSAEETQLVAQCVADLLLPGDLMLASGELGAGKTTFTQGLGAALGIEDRITSPTFVLMCNYEGRLPLHHVDLYRLDQLQEVIDLGLLELLDEGGVGLVEWGEGAAPVLPQEYLAIRLLHGDDDDERHIAFEAYGQSWLRRELKLRNSLMKWIVEDNS